MHENKERCGGGGGRGRGCGSPSKRLFFALLADADTSKTSPQEKSLPGEKTKTQIDVKARRTGSVGYGWRRLG